MHPADWIQVCVVGGLASDCLPVQQNSSYPNRLGPSGKSVQNSTKLTCLEITGYRIKYNTVLWLQELRFRRCRKVQTPVYTANSNSRTANCPCSLLSKKNPVIRIFCMSGGLAVLINLDKCSSSVVRCSPVTTIPPILHTHSFTYHPHYIMFLSQNFSFPLSVPFHPFIHLPPTLYNVSLPAIQFPLSVPFHQCSTTIHSPTTHAT